MRLFRLFAGFLKSPTLEKTFLELTKDYLNNEVRENNLTKSTQQKFHQFYNNLYTFLKLRRREDILPNQITIALMVEFKSYLHKNLKSCTITHSAKHLETVKRILDYATITDYIKFNPIASMKTKRDRAKEIINLTQEEINKLERATFVCKEYHLVRDLYLFQCYTGLSYMDLWRYEIETSQVDIVGGVKKEIQLVTCATGRGKTGKKYWSEFTRPARYIHDKYRGAFPHIDNSRYNRYLKELMDHVGIHKYVTTHTGRKTFATIKKKNGYSTPAIAAMLGNTEQVARTYYIDESKEVVLNEIKSVNLKNGPIN